MNSEKQSQAAVISYASRASIATDIMALRAAENLGAIWMVVTDRETDKTYRAKISDIWRRGNEFDRGWGRQIALPLVDFNNQVAMQMELFEL